MNAGEISPQREEQQRNEDQTLENFQDHNLDREQCGMEGQTRAHNWICVIWLIDIIIDMGDACISGNGHWESGNLNGSRGIYSSFRKHGFGSQCWKFDLAKDKLTDRRYVFLSSRMKWRTGERTWRELVHGMTEGQEGESIKVELKVKTLSGAKGPGKIRTMERVLGKLTRKLPGPFQSHTGIHHTCALQNNTHMDLW